MTKPLTAAAIDAFFKPGSVALIGASNTPDSIGRVLAANLLSGGFSGPVMAVNPHEPAIRSTLAYPDVDALPMAPELAVVAIAASHVPEVIAKLGALGCRAAVVISAGFEPESPEGARHAAALLAAATAAGVRLIGPNCLGVLNPAVGLNASFAHLAPAAGDIALISQSGAVASAALDWAATRGLGFSKVATVGDALDVGVADLLEYLATDGQTRAILLYLESVRDARRFMSAARFASLTKPVIAIKGGRSDAGARAAFSHTGALAGGDLVFSAALRRAGVVQVETLRELFDTALLLKGAHAVKGRRLALLTNGGGAGVLAVDVLDRLGGELAALAPGTIEAISAVASPNWSRHNPADILGDAKPPVYAAALTALCADPGVDAVLALNCPTALVSSEASARAIAEAAAVSGPPVLTCWMGGHDAEAGRAVLSAAGLPTYETPGDGVDAFLRLIQRGDIQRLLLETPEDETGPSGRETADKIIGAALADGRMTLDAVETLAILRAYGVPTVDSRTAADPVAAGAAALAIGSPVALKILSPDITHKTDVGGVILGVAPDRAAAEAGAMLERVRAARPDARIAGFIVQAMADRGDRLELLAGIGRDPVFGPVILFGQGGVTAEAVADRAVGLPPLDSVLAEDMIAHTRVAALFGAHRGQPGPRRESVVRTLTALARLAVDFPTVVELDINPLVAGTDGALALDGRIRLDPAAPARLAIAPYPTELVQDVTLDGQPLRIRPVRADDAGRLVALVNACSAQDIFLRFGAGMKRLPAELAARLSHVDYDRQLALAAAEPDGRLVGVARLAIDPGDASGEFAILVRSDRHGHAIGRTLMEALLSHAQSRGLTEVRGETEVENTAMVDLARRLGFAVRFSRGEVQMSRRLGDQASSSMSQ